MVDKTTDEFRALCTVTGGDVCIGCAESHLIKNVSAAIAFYRNHLYNM